MKRFILNEAPDNNGRVRLAGNDYHYLVRVRRLAPGEYFPALLPSGEETFIRVQTVEGGVLTGECTAPESPPQTSGGFSAPPLVLFQALPKGDKMDIIVRQAAEGALSEIVPFVSEFSIPKIKGKEKPENGAGAKKTARWERIIKEARQQSGSGIATAIRQPVSINELFVHWEAAKKQYPGALGLLFHHLPLYPPDGPLVQTSLHGYLDKGPEMVALAVGPEGGFSPGEAERFLEAGFRPLTIGNTILRTETAALYAAAAIRIILLERNSWEMKKHGNVSIC
ncbi:MAG: 16S rRNA (uracil(1498)-N(3))-methyltransferase [Treponema sp.]|jgi:16S rRNA (uracil1498-N3)-methyltransferase|nr:16S rRNA (uracil(1498)-N(3))-methyltransferase [Treponema sp.]